MPTSSSKLPDRFVVLGMHAENQLNVFVRTEDDQLHQAAKIATHNGVSPASMTAVMADLADTFGWRQIATEPSEVPHNPSPPARVLPAPTREVRSAAAGRASTISLPPGMTKGKDTKAIYQRLIVALDEAGSEGLRFAQLHAIVGRSRSSGQVFGYMATLLKRGLVFKPSEGVYVRVQGTDPESLPDSRLAASHPAVTSRRGKHSGSKAGNNIVHAVTIEQVIEYVSLHPEGVRVPQIAEALLPGEHENRHTVSNRIAAHFTRAMRTGEPQLIHKVVVRGEHNVKVATYYPGPPP